MAKTPATTREVLGMKPHHILRMNTVLKRLGDKSFTARIYGNWFRFQDEPGSITPHIVYEEISRGFYHPQQKLKPGDVVVDLGAHVGMFTIPLAKRNPEVEFICVEPDTRNFTNLTYNVQRSSLENVKLLHLGLWSGECQLHSKHNETNSGGSSTIPVDIGECRGTTWQKFREQLGLNKINLLKMDIEGAEFQIIRDPTDLEGVEEILAEIHGDGSRKEIGMKQLLETVPKNRLQLIHGSDTYSAWENGKPFHPRDLDNYCLHCGQIMSPWIVEQCPGQRSGYNCVPT